MESRFGMVDCYRSILFGFWFWVIFAAALAAAAAACCHQHPLPRGGELGMFETSNTWSGVFPAVYDYGFD